MKYLEYKGYTGTIEYSSEDNLLFGQVMGIRSLISYEGGTGKELESDFKEAIDTYLADCNEDGIKPEKAFKGNFNVRVSADLHKQAALYALKKKMSLNSLVAESIKYRLIRKSDLAGWEVSQAKPKSPTTSKRSSKTKAARKAVRK